MAVPSRIPHRISKIIFAFGADEFLAMLEGKIRKCLFFYVEIFSNNSVIDDESKSWMIGFQIDESEQFWPKILAKLEESLFKDFCNSFLNKILSLL